MPCDTSDLESLDREDITSMYSSEVTFLYHNVTQDGTCACVYEVNGVRHYRAMEYTCSEEDDCEYWEQCYGYDTTEKHFSMGERYKGLFGDYEREVFYTL